MTKSNIPVIELSNLTIQRDGTTILSGVNWRVNRGEHWVVLGGNGSGKTTLVSALSGYFMPSNGDIDLLGKRFGQAHWPTLRRRIGIVSSSVGQMMALDEPAVNVVVTGKYGMIDLWGQPKPADRSKARRLLRYIGGGHLAARPWAVLSQGERQRVLIARALMACPHVLLLDEPCAGLDPVSREGFLNSVNELGQSSDAPTVVLVTHHVEEITPIFSHVLLLRGGTVVAGGAKSDIMKTGLMTEIYGRELKLKTNRGRYRLDL